MERKPFSRTIVTILYLITVAPLTYLFTTSSMGMSGDYIYIVIQYIMLGVIPLSTVFLAINKDIVAIIIHTLYGIASVIATFYVSYGDLSLKESVHQAAAVSLFLLVVPVVLLALYSYTGGRIAGTSPNS